MSRCEGDELNCAGCGKPLWSGQGLQVKCEAVREHEDSHGETVKSNLVLYGSFRRRWRGGYFIRVYCDRCAKRLWHDRWLD